MPRITHIAIKVQNLEEATKFYEEVYGLREVLTGPGRTGGHISRHMTDGYIDLALMLYDSEDAPEAQLAGPGPCIHHIGFDVDDRVAFSEKVKQHGGVFLSPNTFKYRSPDGTLAELSQAGNFDKLREAKLR